MSKSSALMSQGLTALQVNSFTPSSSRSPTNARPFILSAWCGRACSWGINGKTSRKILFDFVKRRQVLSEIMDKIAKRLENVKKSFMAADEVAWMRMFSIGVHPRSCEDPVAGRQRAGNLCEVGQTLLVRRANFRAESIRQGMKHEIGRAHV